MSSALGTRSCAAVSPARGSGSGPPATPCRGASLRGRSWTSTSRDSETLPACRASGATASRSPSALSRVGLGTPMRASFRAAAPFGLGLIALHQLVEVAALAGGGLFLNDERQPVLVELPEPLVPGDLLERVAAAVAGKIEPDHPDVIAAAGP